MATQLPTSALPNPYPTGPGYWLGAADGGVFSFGDAQFLGSAGSTPLNKPIVGIASTPYYEGYWEVSTDGGIFTYGGAGFYGSAGGAPLNQPIVGMAPHPSGLGYWLVAADGGIFSYGASNFQGSTGGIRLNSPIAGMASTPSGNGYWLVATDGGIFAFGDAAYKGSMGGLPLNKPIVGMASTPHGGGYQLVASDGGIFAFGTARFFGSTGGIPLNKPIVGMAATPTGGGYSLVATDGGIFSYGNAPFLGSTGGIPLNKPVIGFAYRPPLSIAVDPFANDDISLNRSSNWVFEGGDERILLTHGATGTAGGARVLGAESLNAGQLGTVGYTTEAGTTCSAQGPFLQIYADTNGDGAYDRTNTINCFGGAQVVSANPLTSGSSPLPSNAVVTGIDIVYFGNGTARVDDIKVAGITVPDHRTFSIAGTGLG